MKIDCVECFKNLSVESRLRIYNYIKKNKKANVKEITDFIELKQPTVSYHLKEMQLSGLLIRESNGKSVYYSINDNCPHDGDNCFINKSK